MDANDTEHPEMSYNYMPFPMLKKGGSVTMLKDGHILYEPKLPRECVALSILIMESDGFMTYLTKQIESILRSKIAGLGLQTVISNSHGHFAIIAILKEMAQLLAEYLNHNKDNVLFKTDCVFLRDDPVPFDINRCFEFGNEYVSIHIAVKPLDERNRQGLAPKLIKL